MNVLPEVAGSVCDPSKIMSFKNKFCDAEEYTLESLSSTISEFTKDMDLLVALITSNSAVFVTNPPPRVPADSVVDPSASALFKTELDWLIWHLTSFVVIPSAVNFKFGVVAPETVTLVVITALPAPSSAEV